jgi:hypothetical protein
LVLGASGRFVQISRIPNVNLWLGDCPTAARCGQKAKSGHDSQKKFSTHGIQSYGIEDTHVDTSAGRVIFAFAGYGKLGEGFVCVVGGGSVGIDL